MVLGLHFLRADDALYNTLFVDDEGSTEGTHVLAPIQAFLTPHTKLIDQLLVCVGNQREGEGILFDKLLMRLFAIYADAYHFVAGPVQGVVVVAQVAGLGGTSRCTVLRIEVEHQLLSFIIAQADFFAFLVNTQYFGGFVSYVHFEMVSG